MTAWELPTSFEIGGVDFDIRSDFRAILDILKYLNNPEYEEDEQALICLIIFYPEFKQIPQECYQDAINHAMDFISADIKDEGKPAPRLMDWEQDGTLIIPAVNKVLGSDCRSSPYLHWWTFIGAYMEIGESIFSEVINIREKKIKGKKLEKYEREFYQKNKGIIDLIKRESEEEKEEKARLNALLT